MDEGVCAVRPGIDVAGHARLLAGIHDAVLSGRPPQTAPRLLVERSWRRVAAQGVDPDRPPAPDPVGVAEVERRRSGCRLSEVLPELRGSLTSVAEDAHHLMVVTDADGVVLWREGARRVRHRADSLGFTEGATWSEPAIGSNAIGTALAEAAPVQMFAAEHFVRSHHTWACTAYPVHDPRSGELLGIVDVSGPAEAVHPMTVALVGTSVRLVEALLWQRHETRLQGLRQLSGHVLRGGPGLVVDDHGWVAAQSGVSGIDRVAAPSSGVPVAVRGIGACEPEPVPGGWLLRPSRREPLRLTLELGAPRAIVEGSTRWTHPLGRRQAELLRLIVAAGPAGVSAAQLSETVYGDRTHLVTVRAELSRLRKLVGGLLLARPYRIAPGVEAAVQP
ncbi:GAF domain-containing protein [Amycolatopsis lexingtonensis]|uniref:GAF domain-containing protein n=1 Tax=Amycolatopsis lexingtonensis TaxID=218822 RepID=UPI003F6EFD38